jgi:hypothetical protein
LKTYRHPMKCGKLYAKPSDNPMVLGSNLLLTETISG